MIKSAWVCVLIFKDLEEMVVKSVDDDDSSDEKLNGIQKVSYLHGEKRFAIGVDISFLDWDHYQNPSPRS